MAYFDINESELPKGVLRSVINFLSSQQISVVYRSHYKAVVDKIVFCRYEIHGPAIPVEDVEVIVKIYYDENVIANTKLRPYSYVGECHILATYSKIMVIDIEPVIFSVKNKYQPRLR
jgi:hypothetical protein